MARGEGTSHTKREDGAVGVGGFGWLVISRNLGKLNGAKEVETNIATENRPFAPKMKGSSI